MATPDEQRLIEEIGQRIAWYSTALMRVKDNVVYPLTDVFMGCGTFVQIGDRYGILTAHHVVKELIPPFRLGLILKLEQAESFMIDNDHLTIYELAVSDDDEEEVGHDLAFIELYQPDVGTIKATKHFVNLSLERNTVLPEPLQLNQGAWFIWGAAASLNTMEPPEHGIERIIGLHGLCGPGLAVEETQDTEFDYVKIQVNYGTGYETPRSFRGYSGGGLWQIKIDGISTDSPTPTEWIYSGVIIHQSELAEQKRVLTCHGRHSVYQYAYSRIQERST